MFGYHTNAGDPGEGESISMPPEDVREYQSQQYNRGAGQPLINPVPEMPLGEDKHVFTSGAASSGRKPRYDLIPTWALQRIAARFQMGAEKYGENNWQKGASDKAFTLDRLNHAIDHLLLVRDQIHDDVPFASHELFTAGSADDDLAAVILNTIFVMSFQRSNEEIPF